MNVSRAACVPIAVHDPYFSIWCRNDALNEGDLIHWSGKPQTLRGWIEIDDTPCCFMGDPGEGEIIPQNKMEVTALSTTFQFENDAVSLGVSFLSPLLPDDLFLESRPCTYIRFQVKRKRPCRIRIGVSAGETLVSEEKGAALSGLSDIRTGAGASPGFRYALFGRSAQRPLGGSGDNVTINWGYALLASDDPNAEAVFDPEKRQILCVCPLEDGQQETGMILAYDDLASIDYFGNIRRACWTRKWNTILDAVGAAFADREETTKRAESFDQRLEKMAEQSGGRDYAFLCILSYRQCLAAHKLIEDEEGKPVFLSKENDSNGCIGTVDVSYPSVPLFLLFNPVLVEGMIRPVMRFAASDVWKYDFAPHDVGRYPYAWGQVYGLVRSGGSLVYENRDGDVYPPFALLSGQQNCYDETMQMPVEECGNMLIMTAAVCCEEQSAAFALPYLPLLEKWVRYLERYGRAPGNQLCTDDFAGHLDGNVNLSFKAVMGIEAWSQIQGLLGNREKQEQYHRMAAAMAEDVTKRAVEGDHTRLAFGRDSSWSLKYNLIWDRYFHSNLFPQKLFETETDWYLKKTARFGAPLDCRADYTKSDWLLWCSAFTDESTKRQAILAPVARYLRETKTRYPFGDWYDTVTGEYCHFKARSVQGGIFMPILIDRQTRENGT